MEIRIGNETVPASGTVQLKVQLTDPHPILTGRMRGTFASEFFDAVEGVALFSPANDVAGTAVIRGTDVRTEFTSTLGQFGNTLDYPIMTVAVRLRSNAGGAHDVILDSSSTFSLFGTSIPYTLKKGTITPAGALFISDILPGGGLVPAGSIITVKGGGFASNTQLTVKDATGTASFVDPSTMRFLLSGPLNLTGAKITVKNPSNNEQVEYFSYMRGIPVGATTKPLLALATPIFTNSSATTGFLPGTALSGNFVGLALQNQSQNQADVTLDLVSSGGSNLGHAVVSLANGNRYVRDLAEIFGVTPPSGSNVYISSNVPVQMLGMTGDDVAGTVSPVLINAPPSAILQFNPGSLTFNMTAGGTAPLPQSVSLTSTGGALNYTLSTNNTPWLQATPATGTTPQSLSVSVIPGVMGAGTYNANITITPSSGNPVTVPVTFTITASSLIVNPTSLTFQGTAGATSPASKPLTVTTSPLGATYTVNVNTTSGGPWLSVTPSGSTTASSLSVNVNTTGLTVGTYSGSVLIQFGPGAPTLVPVILTLQGPTVLVSPNSLTFNAVQGAANPAPQPLVLNTSPAGLAVSATENPSTSWLSISPASGASPVSSSVSVNTTSLAAGVYFSTITVSANGAIPVNVPVTLIVSTGPIVNPSAITSPAAGTILGPTATFNWSNTGASKYKLIIGHTQGSADIFTTETAATTATAPAIPQDGSTVYAQLFTFSNGLYLLPVTVTYSTGGGTTGNTPLRFVPVAPCRLADTRTGSGFTGNFGPPSMTAGGTRDFTIPGTCSIPPSAKAYSLNATVVPKGPLSFLALFPTGQTRPVVSTLNAFDGSVTSNAAIVPAGTNRAISAFATDATDLLLDINGYFTDDVAAQSYFFFPLTPCRLVDTRNAADALGGPTMNAGATRDFPLPSSSCLSAAAQAYSLNITAVPGGPLSFLTSFPTGQARPNVSTLNAFDGSVKANAALMPAGTNGAVSVFVTDRSDVILDINGYFGGAGAEGLQFYPLAPCRVADTRNAAGLLGGPVMNGGTTRDFPVPSSTCGIQASAKAYSMNITVVPTTALSFLTTWPAGGARPLVSTLNSFQGRVVANAAIVPAGTSGAISVFVTDTTHVILDINGYFAP